MHKPEVEFTRERFQRKRWIEVPLNEKSIDSLTVFFHRNLDLCSSL